MKGVIYHDSRLFNMLQFLNFILIFLLSYVKSIGDLWDLTSSVDDLRLI